MKKDRPKFQPTVRQAARALNRLVYPDQKEIHLANLGKQHGATFAEQVARYADDHPNVR